MTRTERRRNQRGQAVVETALSLLLFTTIFIFGIHFAEVGYLSLKVTEAANYATFEMPFQKQFHNADANTWGDTSLAGPESTSASKRYEDFDGRQSKVGSTVITQIFTRANGMKVTCSQDNAVVGLSPASVGGVNAINATPNSGVSCIAEADVAGFGIPKGFAQQGTGTGFFHRAHYTPTTIHVCSLGRAKSGNCAGKIGILLDDWGFTGAQEARDCPLSAGGCPNQGYYQAAKRLFSVTGHGGSNLALMAAQDKGTDETQMWMSFVDEDAPSGKKFTEDEGNVHYGDATWETTPFTLGGASTPYSDSFAMRSQGCFLGLDCSSSTL